MYLYILYNAILQRIKYIIYSYSKNWWYSYRRTIKKKFKQTLYSGKTNNLLPKPYNNISLQHQYYTTLYKYRNLLNINFKNIKIFTIVRNPYDRIISDLFWYRLIRKDFTAEQVYKIIKNDYIGKNFDNHNRPQYKFITDKNFKLFKNVKLFKTETLNQDNQKLNDYLGININIKINNINKDYSRYLNKDSINLINYYYKYDFKIFNYKMK